MNNYIKSLDNLINVRNNVKNEISRRKHERLNLLESFEPLSTLITEPITKKLDNINNINNTYIITSDDGERINLPAIKSETTQEEQELWNDILNSNPTRQELGTLRFTSEKNGTRLYRLGDKLLAVNNNLILVNTEGKTIKLNKGLNELFFKSNPTNYTKEDSENYRNYIKSIGVNLNFNTIKQRAISDKFPKEGNGLVVLPDDTKILKDRLKVLLSAKSEGHNNVFNEANEILKLLLNKNKITNLQYKEYLKFLSTGVF